MKEHIKNIQIIVILMLITFLCVMFKENNNLKKEVEELLIKTQTIEEKIPEVVEDKDAVFNYNNEDDLIKDHMIQYIKNRYTKTPKVVAKEISENVVQYSKKYELPPELVLGIIEIESCFNPLVESSKGAKGLMQVMPEWVPKMGLKDVNELHEINIGIDTGIRVFLIHLEEAEGSISGGLYRYVNKDYSYVQKVYAAVGRFVAYRSTINFKSESEK